MPKYVHNTKLWYAIRHKLPEEIRADVRKELQKVMDSDITSDFTANNIDTAFIWAATPQGRLYWSTLLRAYRL